MANPVNKSPQLLEKLSIEEEINFACLIEMGDTEWVTCQKVEEVKGQVIVPPEFDVDSILF